MVFFKKSEIEERKSKSFVIMKTIADLQEEQNQIKEELERLRAKDLALQNEQNTFIKELNIILAEAFVSVHHIRSSLSHNFPQCVFRLQPTLSLLLTVLNCWVVHSEALT